MKQFTFEKSVDKASKYRLIGVTAFVSIGIVSCAFFLTNKTGCKKVSNDLRNVASLNREDIEEKCVFGSSQAPTYTAEFKLLPEDLERLKQYAHVANNVHSWYSTVPNSANPESTLVQKGKTMQSLLYTEYIGIDSLVRILIDMSNSEQYVVYYEKAPRNW